MRGDIRSSRVDVLTTAGPILLRLGHATKMAVSSRFHQAPKIENLSESEVFQMTSRLEV